MAKILAFRFVSLVNRRANNGEGIIKHSTLPDTSWIDILNSGLLHSQLFCTETPTLTAQEGTAGVPSLVCSFLSGGTEDLNSSRQTIRKEKSGRVN